MINHILQQLGFSDKEQSVYLSILHAGRITPARLSRQTGLNRTTVYSVAQMLQQKGVISEDATAPTLTYISASPDDLSNLIDGERRALKKRESLVNEVISELEQIDRDQGVATPKLTFIRESEVERFLYQRTPTWNDSMRQYDSIWWGFQSPTFVAQYREWIDWYWQERAFNDLSLQMETSDAAAEQEVAKAKYTRRQMHYWDAQTIKETTWVLGDYLVLIATDQRPFYLVEIQNPPLCATLREMFKLIWSKQ